VGPPVAVLGVHHHVADPVLDVGGAGRGGGGGGMLGLRRLGLHQQRTHGAGVRLQGGRGGRGRRVGGAGQGQGV
jgi:hypothetical protein